MKKLFSILCLLATFAAFAQGGLQWKANVVPAPHFSTNLPLIVIDVQGGAAVTGSNQNAVLKIKYAGGRSIDGVFDVVQNIRIKTRGSSSAEEHVTKKQYAITPRTADFSADAPRSFFDWPVVDKDYILQANYYDRSQFRFDFNLRLWALMGSGYGPRSQLCEVILNGQYWGTHAFMDKITRNADRLNIAASTNAAPDGGAILKKDGLPDADEYRYTSGVNVKSDYIFVYPKVDPANLAATANIQAHFKARTDAFETALAAENFDHPTEGWAQYADRANMADMIILIELTKILDGYVRSMYYYYEGPAGKLKYCPWDVGDWSFGDAERTGSSSTSGFWYNSQTTGQDSPSWAARMMSGPNFAAFLKARWQTLRAGPFSNAALLALMDDYLGKLNARGAIGRNFQRWDFLKRQIADVHVTPVIGTYAAEIAAWKAWMPGRANWLDTQWQ